MNTSRQSLFNETIIKDVIEYLESFPYKDIKELVSKVELNMCDKDKVEVLSFILQKELGAQVYHVLFNSIDMTGQCNHKDIQQDVIDSIKKYLEEYPYKDIKELLPLLTPTMDTKDRLGLINYLIMKNKAVYLYHIIFNSVDFGLLKKELITEEKPDIPERKDSKKWVPVNQPVVDKYDIHEVIDLPMPVVHNWS